MSTWWMTSLFLGLLACGDPGIPIDNQLVELGCGTCIYKVAGGVGCYWAAHIDGEVYHVQGTVTMEPSFQAQEGVCYNHREAMIAGALREDKQNTTRFELQPLTDIPENPTFTPQDIH